MFYQDVIETKIKFSVLGGMSTSSAPDEVPSNYYVYVYDYSMFCVFEIYCL